MNLHKPDRVFYVLEGHPKARHEALPEYKANRELLPDDPDFVRKVDEMKRFFAGHTDVLELLMKAFPVTICKHADHECDDTIYNLCRTFLDYDGLASGDEVVVASNDSDFTQLPQQFYGVKVWNMMTKKWVEPPPYDYVKWKALRGDGCDNIPGIPGIGDKTATKIMEDPALMSSLLNDPEKAAIFERNVNLIHFHDFSEEEFEGMVTHVGKADWEKAKEVFASYHFNSIINDKSWKTFTETFEAAGKIQ